jgi:phosphate starvation-inducible PhoH-like protein
MSTRKPTRKRKESSSDFENEFIQSYKKNFDFEKVNLKKHFPFTQNQTQCYYTINDPNTHIMFIDGLAGTNKTYMSVYAALEHLKENKVDQIIYIRSVVESSSRSMGALPGELDEKFSPYTMPLMDKLNEIVDPTVSNMLLSQKYIRAIPVNFVRGLTFHDSFVIVDEAQNMSRGELTTILTRFGRNSKYIVCGDAKQCDIKDSGFEKIHQLFDTEHSRKNNIHCMKFDTDDVVRSPILKHITSVLGV